MWQNAYLISTPSGRVNVKAHFMKGGSLALICDFEPLAQREFVDEVERKFFMHRIKKPRAGECIIYLTLPRDTERGPLLEYLSEIFESTIKDEE